MDREKTSNPSGRKRRTVTLRDIGLATGYSANTVSRSLADKPDIAPETKEKIRKAAEQMGYIVNAAFCVRASAGLSLLLWAIYPTLIFPLW